MNIVFLPLARVSFSITDAELNFKKSFEMLEGFDEEIITPKELLTSPDMLSKFADNIIDPDLIIYQCSTFIGSDFITEVTRRFSCPIVIWAVREPSIDGGRLKLNSLTGAFSAGNSLYSQNLNFQFVFGNPDEEVVIDKFKKIYKSLALIKKLRKIWD